jgi:hypothetical protein
MSPVRYELGFYIPEDVVLHSHRRENLKTYIFPVIFSVGVSHQHYEAEQTSQFHISVEELMAVRDEE